MNDIVRIMSSIFRFFPGHDEPLVCSDGSYGNLFQYFVDVERVFGIKCLVKTNYFDMEKIIMPYNTTKI